MARDHTSGADSAGGPGDRPDSSGRSERLDDIQRIETEKDDRARTAKEHDATHDPVPAFEQAHRDLPAQDRSPGKYTAADFDPDSRAEFEEATGQTVEDALAKRDQAMAQPRDTTAAPELAPYPDRPADHVGNDIVRWYNTGQISYNDALRRLDSVGIAPNHPEITTDGDEQAGHDERTDTPGDGGEVSQHDTAESAETSDTGKTSAAGETGEQPDERSEQSSAEPDRQDPEPSDTDPIRPDLEAPTDTPTETEIDQTGEAYGQLEDTEPPVRTDAISEDTGTTTPEGQPDPDRAVYSNPSDVRDAVLSGKSTPEIRRELADQPADPPNEPTTDLVGEHEGYRYEKGTPQDDSTSFGERVAHGQSDDTSRAARSEQKREARTEAIGGLADRAAENVNRLEQVTTNKGSAPASGTIECHIGPPEPVASAPTQHPSLGNEFVLAAVAYLVGEKTYQKVGAKYLAWYHRGDGKEQDQ